MGFRAKMRAMRASWSVFAPLMDPLEALAQLAPPRGSRDWRGVTFVALCRELRVTLEPGQETIALVAFDGVDPIDLPERLRPLARRIFGPVDSIPPEARAVLALVAGARGGKSYVFGGLRIVHLALTVPLDTLAPGEKAFGTIFAGDPRQREQCFRYALGAARSHPSIRAMIQGKARDDEDFAGSEFTLKRRDGSVTIESLPPKAGGGSGRGRSLVGAILEEAAFFQDENHVVNDVDVFKAVTPRVLPGGQTVVSSTPWAEAGLLYDEFVANHPEPRCAAPHLKESGRPHRAIAAHAPTLLLRDVEFTRRIVSSERARDPVNCSREYDAQFLPLSATQFFDPASIAEAVDPSLELGSAPSDDPQAIRVLGADLGFVRDAATSAAVERTPAGYTLLNYTEQLPRVERLKPSQIFAGIAEQALTHHAEEVVADQHYAEAAKEAFWDRGLVFIALPGGNLGKAEVFSATDHLFREGLVRLPNDARLLQQLREVKKRPLPGGGYSIEQPRKAAGGHGDIVSAFVAAAWRLSKLQLPEAPKATHADPAEAKAQAWRERDDERIEKKRRAKELEEWGVPPPEELW